MAYLKAILEFRAKSIHDSFTALVDKLHFERELV